MYVHADVKTSKAVFPPAFDNHSKFQLHDWKELSPDIANVAPNRNIELESQIGVISL